MDGAHRGFAVVELENEAAARSATQMDGLLIADKYARAIFRRRRRGARALVLLVFFEVFFFFFEP